MLGRDDAAKYLTPIDRRFVSLPIDATETAPVESRLR